MLLVAILVVFSGQPSQMVTVRFAKRYPQAINQLLGKDLDKTPSDSTFRLLLTQLDVDTFEAPLKGWTAAQPGVAEFLDSLVCNGKTLRGSISETLYGAASFIAQLSLYSQSLVVAIAQTTYLTDAGSETRALWELLESVEFAGVLVQADALHANRSFRLPRPARRRLPVDASLPRSAMPKNIVA